VNQDASLYHSIAPLDAAHLASALLLFCCIGGLWALSLHRRDASIVDSFWALGFALVSLVSLWRGPGSERALLAAACTTLWAARLSLHLLRRNLAHGEDRRYAAMRKRFDPGWWWKSFFIVFLLQGVLIWVISLPLQYAGAAPSIHPPGSPGDSLGLLDALGALLFLAGFLCEALADAQLEAFKKDPSSAGRVLDTGLWRYSRHPNYFGNALLWWGLSLFGVATGPWWLLCAPALMTFLLLRVSGVTLLEKDIGERRPEYSEYIRRTSSFIPWPPRIE
jgi:steroid 5-alpha reductase family enzyme